MNFPNLIGLGTNRLTQVVELGGVMWPKWHHTKLDWWIHFHSFCNWLWLQLIVTDPVDPFSNKIRSSSLFCGSGHLPIWTFLSLYYGHLKSLEKTNGHFCTLPQGVVFFFSLTFFSGGRFNDPILLGMILVIMIKKLNEKNYT